MAHLSLRGVSHGIESHRMDTVEGRIKGFTQQVPHVQIITTKNESERSSGLWGSLHR